MTTFTFVTDRVLSVDEARLKSMCNTITIHKPKPHLHNPPQTLPVITVPAESSNSMDYIYAELVDFDNCSSSNDL